MNIGVVGLGKLGLPLALTYASENKNVMVYDRDESVRDAVRSQRVHVTEPLVNEMMRTTGLYVATLDELTRHSDIIFVVVPTPSLPNGAFDNSYVVNVIESLAAYTSGGGGSDKVIAIVSTVSPGSFSVPEDDNLCTLAQSRGYRLAYAPTLIALGSVVHDLIYPDVQMIGLDENDDFTRRVVSKAVRTITRSPIVVTDFESAALAKLASNVFVTMKIGFANTLAQLCDGLHADVDDVTQIMGLNKRIGPKSLTAGAGYGGPCFPRDAAAFAAVARGSSAELLGTTVERLNAQHLTYVMRHVREWSIQDKMTFCVLGRGYKEGSPHDIESFGATLEKSLDKYLEQTEVWDADIVVVAQPLLGQSLRSSIKSGAYVYDLWGTHGYLAEREDITYDCLGRRS